MYRDTEWVLSLKDYKAWIIRVIGPWIFYSGSEIQGCSWRISGCFACRSIHAFWKEEKSGCGLRTSILYIGVISATRSPIRRTNSKGGNRRWTPPGDQRNISISVCIVFPSPMVLERELTERHHAPVLFSCCSQSPGICIGCIGPAGGGRNLCSDSRGTDRSIHPWDLSPGIISA